MDIRQTHNARHIRCDRQTNLNQRGRVGEKLEYLYLEVMIQAGAQPLLQLYRLRFFLVAIVQEYHNYLERNFATTEKTQVKTAIYPQQYISSASYGVKKRIGRTNILLLLDGAFHSCIKFNLKYLVWFYYIGQTDCFFSILWVTIWWGIKLAPNRSSYLNLSLKGSFGD